MSKKKRQQVTIISLVAALVVICIAYFAVVKSNDKKDEEADTSVNLLQLDSDSIVGINVTNEEGVVDLDRTDGSWKLTSDDEFIVSEDVMNLILESLANLNATKCIDETNDNLDEFGLDNPAAVVVVTQKDGTKTTINLGDSIPVSSINGYYGAVEGKDGVYALSDYDTGIFFKGQIDYKGESLQEFGEDEAEARREEMEKQR